MEISPSVIMICVNRIREPGSLLSEKIFEVTPFRTLENAPLKHRIYRKLPNISPGLVETRKHFMVGLYSGVKCGGSFGLTDDL